MMVKGYQNATVELTFTKNAKEITVTGEVSS
jgi:hypothetical protein